MEGTGYGFLVPVFFVTSGMKLDVLAVSSADGVLRVLLFTVALLLTHLPVAMIGRRVFAVTESVALYLYSATTLSLIVAMTDVAVSKGAMQAGEASALVVFGVISVSVFPFIAAMLLKRTDTSVRFSVENDRGGL